MDTLQGSVHRIKSLKTLCHSRFHSGSQMVQQLLYDVDCDVVFMPQTSSDEHRINYKEIQNPAIELLFYETTKNFDKLPIQYRVSITLKMNRISRCDWLPERAIWSYLARSGYGLCPASIQIMLWCCIPYNKSFIDQACSVKMAGY